jgi:hypothetical protein
MKTLRYNRIVIILFVAASVFLLSCAKDEKDPIEPPPTGGNTSAGEFKWSPAGSGEIKSDSSYFIPAFNNIVAFKGNSTIDIILSALSPGTYTISSSQGNSLEYNTGSTVYKGSSGIVTISANTGSRLTGSFSCDFGGATPAINGQFTNIPDR